MIGTILKAEEYETRVNQRKCIRLTLEVDSDTAYGFIAVEALETVVIPFLRFCRLPVITDKDRNFLKIHLSKLPGKLIPMTRTRFRDLELWAVDFSQMRRANEQTKHCI